MKISCLSLLLVLLFLVAPLWAADPAQGNLCQPSVSVSRIFWIPQAAHGLDDQGNRFNTEFMVINLGGDEIEATFISCSEAGQPLPLLSNEPSGGGTVVTAAAAPVAQLKLKIGGHSAVRVRSLNQNPDTLSVGYALLLTAGAVGLEVVFTATAGNGIATSTNVRPFPIITATAFFADSGPLVNTGVALLLPFDSEKPADQKVDVLLALVNASGQVIDRKTVQLTRGRKIARFLSELFDMAPHLDPSGRFFGTIELRATPTVEPVAVMPLRLDQVPLPGGTSHFVLTTQSIFPPRSIPNL